jgi:hypothetical protein
MIGLLLTFAVSVVAMAYESVLFEVFMVVSQVKCLIKFVMCSGGKHPTDYQKGATIDVEIFPSNRLPGQKRIRPTNIPNLECLHITSLWFLENHRNPLMNQWNPELLLLTEFSRRNSGFGNS